MRASGWIALGMLLGFGLQSLPLGAETAKSSRSKTSTRKPAYEGDMAPVLEKLDDVIANQETILGKFDAVMEELRIVKVRALMGGSGSGN